MIPREKPYIVTALKYPRPKSVKVWARSPEMAAVSAARLREGITGPVRVTDEDGNQYEFYSGLEGFSAWVTEGLDEPEWVTEEREARRMDRARRLERLRKVYGPHVRLGNPWL